MVFRRTKGGGLVLRTSFSDFWAILGAFLIGSLLGISFFVLGFFLANPREVFFVWGIKKGLGLDGLLGGFFESFGKVGKQMQRVCWLFLFYGGGKTRERILCS